jgi:hypothetical protein
MAVEFATARSNNIFSIVLLCITVFFVIAVLIGLNVPFAGGGEASFVALGVIGGFG